MTLARSKHLVFNYSTFNDVHGDYYQNATALGEHGIAQLYRESCPDAVYDSQGRYPPPRCLPSTRQAVLKEIFEWIDTNLENLLWLYGPAGVGKSAIAQTVAEICAKEGVLIASFFFSRDSPGRDTSGRLIPSIVYQLAVSMPKKRSMIGNMVEEDLSILHKSAKAQAEALIVPLFSSDSESNSMARETQHLQPFLIIIDGLDECKGDNNQREVVRIIGELVHNSCIPFRFLIASRPEPQIKSAFRLLTGSMRYVSLSDSHHMIQGKRDVLAFLQEGFKDILEKHHEAMAHVRRPWPKGLVIAQLASKAGGMFIYASTVLRYIDDDDFHPPDRLKEVINTPTGRTPFAELDRLYKHILSECNEIKLLLRVLTVLLLQKSRRSGFLGELEIEVLFQLSPGTVRRALRRMHSLIDITESGKIHFFHASFGDFILNKVRAETYYIDKAEGHALIAEALINFLGTWSGSINNVDLLFSQITVMEYGLDLWSHHCREAHWSKYPLLLETLFTQLDFQWWQEQSMLRNEALKGIKAGIRWLKNLDSLSRRFEYNSISVRKQIIETFWSRALGRAAPPLQAQSVVLFKALDDFVVDGLIIFEHIPWGRRIDWVNRSIQHLSNSRSEPYIMISDVISPSRFAENAVALELDKVILMECNLDDIAELIHDYLEDVSISTSYADDAVCGHIRMSIWCISVLSKNTIGNTETSAFQYARKYWTQHISNAPPGNEDVLNSLESFDPGVLPNSVESSDISVILGWLEMSSNSSLDLTDRWKRLNDKKNKFSSMIQRLACAR